MGCCRRRSGVLSTLQAWAVELSRRRRKVQAARLPLPAEAEGRHGAGMVYAMAAVARQLRPSGVGHPAFTCPPVPQRCGTWRTATTQTARPLYWLARSRCWCSCCRQAAARVATAAPPSVPTHQRPAHRASLQSYVPRWLRVQRPASFIDHPPALSRLPCRGPPARSPAAARGAARRRPGPCPTCRATTTSTRAVRWWRRGRCPCWLT